MSKPMLVCVDDYEKYAREHLNQHSVAYYTCGADEEVSVKENRQAFRRFRIKPRVLREADSQRVCKVISDWSIVTIHNNLGSLFVLFHYNGKILPTNWITASKSLRVGPLRDVSKRDLSTSILGQKIDFPILSGPAGTQCLAHHEGEVAAAKAANAMKTCIVLSTYSTKSLEEVSQAAPNCLRWFQLYIWRPRSIAVNLVRRAEAAGFKALVLTVDMPILGKRRSGMVCWWISNATPFAPPTSSKRAHGTSQRRRMQEYGAPADMVLGASLTQRLS
ncbi:2-Hydroxyacid oxidase 1-like [Ptychodera flava]|uniref:2-Hydroxyacid oxidase 1-like n=1 Tax=Ptychodera flava TaxID=63121 RepID=UPI00396A238D